MTVFQDSPPPIDQEMRHLLPHRSAWPTVIGIISIVIASLCIVCTPLGLVSKDFASSFNPKQAEMTAKMMANMPPWYETYRIASTVFNMMIFILLLVAGILLLRRRLALARTAHIIYALLNLLIVVVGIAILSQTHQAMAEAISPKLREAVEAGMVVGAIFGFAIAAAYPVFLLIWFSRGKIRQEIDSGGTTQGQP